MQTFRINPLIWFVAMMATAMAAAAIVSAPVPARAAGLFDFLFGGRDQEPPPVNSYAEPPSPALGRIAPAAPYGSESVRAGSGETGGHAVAFCVRLCDGQHFPLERMTNATQIETCRGMCPASKTKVFQGSEVGSAVAKDGQRYADLDTAFTYRKQLVAGCTCNGRDAFGLAPYDATKDPTLRPGDIVATSDGFVAYGKNDKSGQGGFTPLDTAGVNAQLMPGARTPASKRATQTQAPQQTVAEEDPGTFTPSANVPPVAGLRNQSFR